MIKSASFFKTTGVALTFLVSGTGLANSDVPATERNKQFIAQAFEQWAEGGDTFFYDVLSSEVVWTIKGSGPFAGTFRGREVFLEEAVAPFAARLSSFIKPTVNDVWADGNEVVVYWDGEGVAVDGVPYNNSFVWIFRMEEMRAVEVIAFLDLTRYEDVINRIPLNSGGDTQVNNNEQVYAGMWVTDDEYIRHELLPNGRYDEARGTRQSAYQGRYEVTGNHINYWDDTGFTADGVFVDANTLHHAGMILRRR